MNNLEKDFRLFAKDNHLSMQSVDDYNNKIVSRYIEPTIIEERKLNATSISIYSRLFMERILFLGSEIDSDVANIMNSQLLFLEMENPDRNITIYLNSPGGSVYDGLSIYDVFKYISCPITTTCLGTAASMAAVLLSSGDKGKRFALPNSQIMIHQPLSNPGYGQASDLEIANNEMQKCKKKLYDILSENTGKSYDDIEKACDRNNWFTAQEGVEYGLIDSVIKRK